MPRYGNILKVVSTRRRGTCYTIRTSTNDEIESEKVVMASGLCTRKVSKMFGVEIPVDSLFRQVFVTNNFQGMPREMPLFIDTHNVTAIGREGSGILIGHEDPNQSRNFEMNFDLNLR
jgi:glycine/D-amino acid oxidase-like deaminating enzyme